MSNDRPTAWSQLECAFFRALTESERSAVVFLDQAQTIRYLNPSAQRLLAPLVGAAAESLVGRPFSSLSSDLPGYLVQQSCEGEVACRLGATELIVSGKPVHHDDWPAGYRLTLRERAAALQELEQRGKLKAVSATQAMIEFDLEGKILSANDNFLATTGYRLDEIQGRHHRLFVDPDYAASPAYAEFWTSLAFGEFKQGEFKRYGKGGREVWILASYNPIFDSEGRPFRVVKFASDITAEKRRADEFSGMLDAIGKAQAMIEFELDGTILTANDNFLAATGYRLDEIQGEHHRMFVDPSYAQSREYRDFWSRLGRGEFSSGEYQRFGKGGREVWIQASYNPILDSEGRPFKVVKFATDITAQKKSSAEFNRRVRQLVSELQAGQLEARADEGGLSPELDGLVSQINDVVGVLAQPIQVATTCVTQLAVGAIPEPLEHPEWQGAFATVRDSINELARATDSVARIAATIADGDLTVQVQPRSEQDVLLRSIGSMAQELC